MGNKKLPVGILSILMLIWVNVSARTSALGPVMDLEQQAYPYLPAPGWEQANTSGFGDPHEQEVSALETFNGYLYAGTYNVIDPMQVFDGARIFRSPDGLTWTPVTQPGFQNAHDLAPPAILDFVVFNTRLYASTGWGGNEAQIWRSINGVNWAPMVTAGFGDPEIHDIAALAVYNNMIYAGASSQVSGARIYRSFSGDSNTWTPLTPAASTMAGAGINGFAEFNGALWATVESEAPVQVWRSTSGSTWTSAVNNGFGDSNTVDAGGMAVFAGYLYVGAGNNVQGAQLWRTNNGTSWSQATTPSFGDPNNIQVESVFVFQNQLYVSVKNTITGVELWRSADGTTWEQINPDGFGDSKNTTSNAGKATDKFLGQLYFGTSNLVDGGEIWRMQQQVAGPSVLSVTRADPDPTSLSSVDFRVTFSVPVTGVDATDFLITKTGSIKNYAITNVSPASGPAGLYTVTVNTGKFNGTLRLDVLNDGSILDGSGIPLAGGFTTGETYTVSKTYIATFLSQAVDDGWVLESAENSGIGGTQNNGGSMIRVGDNAANQQYRSFLSFNTAGLPNKAVISSAKIMVEGAGLVGTDPFLTHRNMWADISASMFGTVPALEVSDFQVTASLKRAGIFTPTDVSGWHTAPLATAAYPWINKTGTTQFRLRFGLDDNNDFGADHFKFYSGNALLPSQPRLVIEYIVP